MEGREEGAGMVAKPQQAVILSHGRAVDVFQAPYCRDREVRAWQRTAWQQQGCVSRPQHHVGGGGDDEGGELLIKRILFFSSSLHWFSSRPVPVQWMKCMEITLCSVCCLLCCCTNFQLLAFHYNHPMLILTLIPGRASSLFVCLKRSV